MQKDIHAERQLLLNAVGQEILQYSCTKQLEAESK